MLGGCGLVLAAIVFFAWRKSTKGWQRVVAWIAGLWALVSMVIFALYLLALNAG